MLVFTAVLMEAGLTVCGGMPMQAAHRFSCDALSLQREFRAFLARRQALVVAFLTLQVADVLTTQRVLAAGGWEGNPMMVWTMAHFGPLWFVPKLAAMAVCAVAMMQWPLRRIRPFVAVMAIVVASNALQV